MRTEFSAKILIWQIDKIIPYAGNPRKNDAAVDRMCGSIREFGFPIPCLVDKNGQLIDGHLRLKAARKLGMTEVPVILCDEWTPEQVKAFRLMVNRSALWAEWDEELLALELEELQKADYSLVFTGFDESELDALLATEVPEEEIPELPADPVSRLGDLWLCGQHRVLCGDATSPDAISRLLAGAEPRLMVTDPPYGVRLDSQWRDRAATNGPATSKHKPGKKARKKRTEGHTVTTISGDSRADWSESFANVSSIEVAYVWHASEFTREVLDGLLRIGFVYHQQIIWDKGRIVMNRTHYWFQHEPCWYVRKKNARWYGKPGRNSTIWSSPSPKFMMGGSDEEKFDHPTQKPIELMRIPIVNHTRSGELVYDPFLGSGTTLAAAEITKRVCCGLELDPRFVDVIVQRWQKLTGKEAFLEGDSRSFDVVARERRRVAA